MNDFDSSLFRAYDIRGTYPDQINERVTYALGQAFVQATGARTVAVGRDVRASGVSLQRAMIQGIVDAGADALDIGTISTEMLYFAGGTLDCDGGMSVTASHNPPQWNGTKFIGKGGVPLVRDEVLGEIYTLAQEMEPIHAEQPGTVTQRDILPDYIAYLQRFKPQLPQPLKVAVNANFGADGKVVDAATADLPLDIVRLNWQEDGTFPKGTPDPLLPENRKEISALIPNEHADFGAAFDADADRCFFYDEQGRFFHPYYITALLINHFLTDNPGGTVIIEPRITWANLDAAAEAGGHAVIGKTGHGFIKKEMRAHDAVFGGESSGHYYYKDFFFCDNGMITFLTVMGIFAKHLAGGQPVSTLLDHYKEKYPIAEQEMNYITDRATEIEAGLAEKYADADQNRLDGLSIEYPTWRFNIRMSNNEPVLRLNLQARTPAERDQRLDEITSYITSFGATLRDDT
jgi:phosphomannomutase